MIDGRRDEGYEYGQDDSKMVVAGYRQQELKMLKREAGKEDEKED